MWQKKTCTIRVGWATKLSTHMCKTWQLNRKCKACWRNIRRHLCTDKFCQQICKLGWSSRLTRDQPIRFTGGRSHCAGWHGKTRKETYKCANFGMKWDWVGPDGTAMEPSDTGQVQHPWFVTPNVLQIGGTPRPNSRIPTNYYLVGI